MIRKTKLPARHGYSWTEAETKALLRCYSKGWTIHQLAAKHQRTVNAITIVLDSYSKDLIINSTNYTILLEKVRKLIEAKIYLTAVLGVKNG